MSVDHCLWRLELIRFLNLLTGIRPYLNVYRLQVLLLTVHIDLALMDLLDSFILIFGIGLKVRL